MGMVALVLSRIIDIYSTVIVVYVLMSWLRPSRGGIVFEIYRTLGTICEPWLGLFRRFIPPIGMVDISPIVAIVALSLISNLVWRLLG